MRADEPFGRIAVPWARPLRHPHDVPIAVDEKGHGRASDPIFLSRFVLAIQSHRIPDVMRLDKRLQLVIFHPVERDTDEHKPLLVERIVEIFERRPLSRTVGSPRSPKIQQHKLAF